jgi:hypothetical protein
MPMEAVPELYATTLIARHQSSSDRASERAGLVQIGP